jgi:hypothetical protein
MSELGVYIDIGAMCLVLLLFFFALVLVIVPRLGIH